MLKMLINSRFAANWFGKDKWDYNFEEIGANRYKCTLTSKMPEKRFEMIIRYILDKQNKISVEIPSGKIPEYFTIPDKSKPLAFKTIKGFITNTMNEIYKEVQKDFIYPQDYEVIDLIYKKEKKNNQREIKVIVEGYFVYKRLRVE